MSATKDIFLAALELAATERDGFIASRCEGDAGRVARIERLLVAHERADDILGTAALPSDSEEFREISTGDRVGHCLLGRFLGEGGFGLVFEALQERPVRRTVAVKVVKAGMGSQQVLRRFEVERQALAIMDHPNIARVFDAGTTAQGRPYFVMEYVDGQPITEYCEEKGLGTAERLELFRTVCLALQHAHQKGVIHRDIKPTNVLVGNVDGVPVPKVIDFGIAKATERSLTDETFVTRDGHVIGTPAYMSPEQFSGAPDVDTRSDVYSLGVLLYELLCGDPPFSTVGVDFMELRRLILEEEPSRPSVIRRRGRTTTTIAIPSELDWITMRSLEKERTRRYPTANALAEDVGRFLAHEPVEAAPPGAWYRVRKLVRRHRAAAGIAAALIVALVLGSAGLGAGLLAARRSEASAQRERENVLRLSMFERLEDLIAEADALWPAVPEKERELEDWLRRAREVVASLEPDPDSENPGHYALLAELEARAEPETPAQRERSIATHPRHADWRRLSAKLDAVRLARDVREGRVEPPEHGLDDADLALDAAALNARAWSLVDPDREEFGREAEGVALAVQGLEVATETERPNLHDTLAWAYLAIGRDEEAVFESEMALESAPPARRREFQGYLGEIRGAVAEADGPGAASNLAALEEEVRSLGELVIAERELPFANDEDRWWHGQLRKLIAEIEAFADEETGLMHGLSPGEGWGVARRLAFASELEELTTTGARARALWDEAIASIADEADCPDYHGLRLEPQRGLLPIGRDPDTALWEFAHVMTGDVPERDELGELVLTDGTAIVLVLVPGGTFLMGAQATDPAAPNYDRLAQDDEGPVHEVTLSPFFLSKFELTQGQWERFRGENPSRYGPSMHFLGTQITPRHPVEQVSWDEVMLVLGRMELTLPTEAQWEYAARAGTSAPYVDGTERDALVGFANLADQAAARGGGRWSAIAEWPTYDDGWSAHAPVGSFGANGFGLHEMLGNVWEWCLDGYHTDFYGSTNEPDPVDPPESSQSRVNRGGGFATGASSARASNRDPLKPGSLIGSVGFRPSRAVD